MNTKNRIIIFGCIIVLAVIIGMVFDVQHYVSRESLSDLQTTGGYAAILLFIFLYIVATVAFLPASILSLAAGAIFGTALGTIYVVIGATIGAVISFLLARYFVRDFVEQTIVVKFPLLQKYNGQFERRAAAIIFILRLAPVVPFGASNYFFGITKAKFSSFFWATATGILPGTLAYVYFGDALASLSLVNILIAVGILVVLSFAALLYNKMSVIHGDNEYDIIVVGAGSGGLNIASFMNKAGFKTLLIDKTDKNIGGDCLNFGCVPSKALLHVAKQHKEGKATEAFGVRMEGEVDMNKVREYIHSKREYIREHESADYFKKQGMDVALGTATFASKKSVRVDGNTYEAKRIVLATGSRPFVPPITGLENISYHTNETIFDISTLPKRLLVVGGGPIGTELGQAFQLLGSEVHIVQNADMLLGREDHDMAQIVMSELENDGVTLHLEQSVEEVVVRDGAKIAVLKSTTGTRTDVPFDEILIATGRQLNIENLELEKAGVATTEDNRKLVIDEYLRTTNKHVFVCGDIVGQHQFTHAAELHAGLLLKNFFTPKPFRKKLNTDSLSWVTYTSPSLATFGISESALQKRNTSYAVLETDFKDDDRAIVDNYTYGRIKLFVGKNNTLLGGTLVAPHAGELVQELILAQGEGVKIDALFNKIYPYPTGARITKSVIAKHFAKKLTSRTKRLLKILY